MLADSANGKPLNAPNDAVVHPNDDSIWFTDPGYGQLMNYEGVRANMGSLQPFQKEAIYRIDAQSGQMTKVADDPFKPNGLCFSADYKKLYVADTGATHYPDAEKIIWQYDIDGAKLRNGPQIRGYEPARQGRWIRGWYPLRRRRERLGQRGLGRRRVRRCAHFRTQRRQNRPDCPARNLPPTWSSVAPSGIT